MWDGMRVIAVCFTRTLQRCTCPTNTHFPLILQEVQRIAKTRNQLNLKLCQRGAWEDRMLVETVLSMLTVVCHFKKVMHRVWAYFQARLAFTMAAFNVLVQWHGFQPNASGFVPLSIAEFSL